MRELICAAAGLFALTLSAENHECYWWFDTRPEVMGQTVMTSGTMKMEIDASDLDPGVHTIHLMVTDETGKQSGTVSRPFVRIEDPMDATAYITVDNELRETLKSPTGTGKYSALLDLKDIKNGFHTIQASVRNAEGTISLVRESTFLRISSDSDIRTGTAYVCIDRAIQYEIPNASVDGVFSADLDLNDLDNGLHTIQAFVKTADGGVSPVIESVFMRVASGNEISQMRCFYSIDDEDGLLYDGKISGDMLYAEIDATKLDEGLHSISFMLMGENGETTQAYTSYFLKLPLGGVNLKNYSYWVNDKMDEKVIVNVDNASNPYTLTGLIPLKKQPFRSTSYRFDVEKGIPVVYAQNDFNLFMMDNRGYATLKSFPYYDTSSRENISSKILPFTKSVEDIKRVEKNDITWYSFTAQKGDSITFKLNTDCAFDIFAPDGTRLITSGSDKSRQIHGAHASMTGTHYVAMHDQLGSSNYFKAYLTLIDKFSLLKWEPGNIAYEGPVIFRFEGNGFDHLKSVELTADKMKSIQPTAFKVADWSYGMAAFDFDTDKIDIGVYYLTLHFDDNGKDKVIKGAVAVHHPVVKDLEVSVNPHNTSVADVRDIDVTIYNPSTIGYWGVPFCVARTSQDPEMMFDFKFFAADCNDLYEDPIFYDTDNLLGTGQTGRYVPMIIPYIGPKEKLKYTFRVPRVINNNFDFFAWCGLPWSQEYKQSNVSKVKADSPKRAPAPDPRLDRNYNTLTQIQNAANDAAGHAPDAVARPLRTGNIAVSIGCAEAGIIGGLDAVRKRAEREAYGGLYDEIEDGLVHYRIPTGMTPIAILNNSGILPFNIRDPYEQTGNQCCQNAEYGEPRPNRNSVQFPASYDPNDIIGYLSESGSNYIGKDVKTVGYTVEFENDPEFATASALSVRIADKLDPKVFDLSSFYPKELKIGKKRISFDESTGSQITTLDMRPEINGIAQITLDYNATNGQILLTLETLNPYTMDISDDLSQGILPVNTAGDGLGEFSFEIDLKNSISHKTKILNKASIVFDTNKAIETPVWENETDFISPVSEIITLSTADDMTYDFEFSGEDSDSGVWRYELYVRSDNNPEWTLLRDNITEQTYTHMFESAPMNPQFVTVAVDMAGNREENEIRSILKGDLDNNGRIDANDLVLLYSYYVGRPVSIDLDVADMNNDGRIDSQDAVSIQRVYLGQTLKKALKRRLINFIR